MTTLRLAFRLLVVSFGVGCGEDSRTTPDATTPEDSSIADANPFDGVDVVAAGLVFNELSPVTGDYIELMNVGTAPIEIAGYRLADQLDGMPRPGEDVVFDAGSELAAGEILLIQAGLGRDARPGEQTACGPGAPPRCYYASWGLSNTTGDTLYLLDPNGGAVLELEYAAGTVTAGAWGRLPDGSGDFANTALTPGQPNSIYVAP